MVIFLNIALFVGSICTKPTEQIVGVTRDEQKKLSRKIFAIYYIYMYKKNDNKAIFVGFHSDIPVHVL